MDAAPSFTDAGNSVSFMLWTLAVIPAAASALLVPGMGFDGFCLRKVRYLCWPLEKIQKFKTVEI